MCGNGSNGCALTHTQPVACAAGFFTLSSVEKRTRRRIAAGICDGVATVYLLRNSRSSGQHYCRALYPILHCCERPKSGQRTRRGLPALATRGQGAAGRRTKDRTRAKTIMSRVSCRTS